MRFFCIEIITELPALSNEFASYRQGLHVYAATMTTTTGMASVQDARVPVLENQVKHVEGAGETKSIQVSFAIHS